VLISYCYLCLQWHELGSHREIVKLPAQFGLWIIKAYCYGCPVIGTVLGVSLLILWGIMGFYLLPAVLRRLFFG